MKRGETNDTMQQESEPNNASKFKILDVLEHRSTFLFVILMDQTPLTTTLFWRIIPQGVEYLRITLRIRKCRTLIDDLQSVEKSQHDTHFMLANWGGS